MATPCWKVVAYRIPSRVLRANQGFRTSRRWIAANAASYRDTLNVKETQLTSTKNGLHVASESSSGGVATVGVWIASGSRNETPKNNGISHLFEHLAFKGTTRKSDIELEAEAENHGIQLSACASRELTAIYAKCLPANIPKAVEILADVVQNHSLVEAAVDNERKAVLKELDYSDTDSKTVVMDYLYATAFQGTSLGLPILGKTESLKSITRHDLTTFLSTHFKPAQMVLAGAGGVNHEELVSLGEKFFGGMSLQYDREIPVTSKCRFTGSEVRARYDDLPLAHVAIAVEGAPFGSHDSLVLSVASAVIGSWNRTYMAGSSLSSRLASANAQEEMCLNFESFYDQYSDTGLWGLHFVADRMTVEDMLFNVQGEWMRLCASVTESEVDRAKSQLKAHLLEQLTCTTASCDDIARHALFTGKRRSLADLDAAIDSINARKVRDVCMKYIYDKCPALSSIGPVEGLPDYNRIRGSMYWLRL